MPYTTQMAAITEYIRKNPGQNYMTIGAALYEKYADNTVARPSATHMGHWASQTIKRHIAEGNPPFFRIEPSGTSKRIFLAEESVKKSKTAAPTAAETSDAADERLYQALDQILMERPREHYVHLNDWYDAVHYHLCRALGVELLAVERDEIPALVESAQARPEARPLMIEPGPEYAGQIQRQTVALEIIARCLTEIQNTWHLHLFDEARDALSDDAVAQTAPDSTPTTTELKPIRVVQRTPVPPEKAAQ